MFSALALGAPVAPLASASSSLPSFSAIPVVTPLVVKADSSLSISTSFGATYYYIATLATPTSATLYKIAPGSNKSVPLYSFSTANSTPVDIAASATDVYILDQSYQTTTPSAITDFNLSTASATHLSSSSFNGATKILASTKTLFVLNPYGGPDLTGSLVLVDLTTKSVSELDSALLVNPSQMSYSGSELYILNPTPFGGTSPSAQVITYSPSSNSFSQLTNPDPGLVNASLIMATPTDLWLYAPPSATPSTNPSSTPTPSSTLYDYSFDTSSTQAYPLRGVPDASALSLVAGSLSTPANIWLSQDTAGPFYDGQVDVFSTSTHSINYITSPAFLYPGKISVTPSRAFVISDSSNDPTSYPTPYSANASAAGSIIASVSLTGNSPVMAVPRFSSGIRPPKTPKANLPEVPGFNSNTCSYSNHYLFINTPQCLAQQLQALDLAHMQEHLPPFALPSNWATLTQAQQLFVAFNIERVDRHIPPYLGINAALSAAATLAAQKDRDPYPVTRGFPLAPNSNAGSPIGGVWAGSFSPLYAIFAFMYEDGWAGSKAATSNFTCVSRLAPGCWGHRNQILGLDLPDHASTGLNCSTCEAGVGFAYISSGPHWASFVGLFERPANHPPAMTFTWAKNVLPFFKQSS